MVSNNVWVEATIAPKYGDPLELCWSGDSSTPASKMHVTLAFSTLKADELDFDALLELRQQLAHVNKNAGSFAAVTPNGAAFLTPSNVAVMLVTGEALWKHHVAYATVFQEMGALESTYPGYLPHITLAQDVVNYGDIADVHRKVREYPHDVIYIDGIYLRAGRTTLPLH